MRSFRPGRLLELASGAAIGGALVVAAVLAGRPGTTVGAGRSGADPRAARSLALPAVSPDSAPEDAPLRSELQRLATVQDAWFEREGSYSSSAASLAYWPVALATIAFEIDSAGASWSASAYDPGAHRQCAVRVGPAPEPYFQPLPEGVIACRTLPRAGEFALWGRSPATTVWESGVGRAVRDGPPILRALRSMQLAWLGDEEEDYGSDFVLLREGQGREPYPDQPGPRTADEDGYVRLADATWGDLLGDGRWTAVIHIIEDTGDSSVDGYLAVVRARSGRLVNGPPYYIGDRTRLLRLRVARGVVAAEMVLRGEHDRPCCPTDTVRMRFDIRGDSLVELDEATDWRLTAGRAPPASRRAPL